ncbi:unnamed protein product [Ectocarpus sp. CCAP 1310/34]|nr:unnamed protein product [Ectocarpus sp. CCAP 1310/34]
MAANDVFGIHQLHLQQQRQISELTARCHELAEAQAEAQRASAAEICLLKSQVNELKNQVEIFRADSRQAAAEAACRPFPISGLTRIASGANGRGNTAVADTYNPLAFVNTAGAAAYTDHIPLEDREAIRHIETDGDDDDDFSDHELPLSPNSVNTVASRICFGWDGKQEPRAQQDGEEPREPRLCGEARLAPRSTSAAADEQAVIPRLAGVKTEAESALRDHRGRDVQASGSPLLNSVEASTSQAPTNPITSTYIVSDSTNNSTGLSDPIAQRDAPDVETGEKSDTFSASEAEDTRSIPRDRYRHCTFCSVCEKPRTEPKAVAKCEACPRILCRKCAGREGETLPKARRRTQEFPKPKKGKDPQAHLLKHIVRHGHDVDLGTMEKRLFKKKQYQSPRGQPKFRTDLEKFWVKCWKYAGYKAGSSDDRAGHRHNKHEHVLSAPKCSDLDEFVPKRRLPAIKLKPCPIYSWVDSLSTLE